MAFKSATRMAMAKGLGARTRAAGTDRPGDGQIPNEFTPRAQRLLTGRRGQIWALPRMPDCPGWDEVEALVPEAELHDLIIELRSIDHGPWDVSAAVLDDLAELRAEVKSEASVTGVGWRSACAVHLCRSRHRDGGGRFAFSA